MSINPIPVPDDDGLKHFELDEPDQPPYEHFAVVEIMGHRTYAGKVTEEYRFGGTMLRIDVPQSDGSFDTKFFGLHSIFAVGECSEAEARDYTQRFPQYDPVAHIRKLLAQPEQQSRQGRRVAWEEDEPENVTKDMEF